MKSKNKSPLLYSLLIMFVLTTHLYGSEHFPLKGLKELHVRVEFHIFGVENLLDITELTEASLQDSLERRLSDINLKVTANEKSPALILEIHISRCSFMAWLYIWEEVRTERNPKKLFKGYTWRLGAGSAEIMEGRENISPLVFSLLDAFLEDYKNDNIKNSECTSSKVLDNCNRLAKLQFRNSSYIQVLPSIKF